MVKAFTDVLIEALAKAGGAPNFDEWQPGGFLKVGPFLTALVAFVFGPWHAVAVAVGSAVFFHEHFALHEIAGAALILAGTAFTALRR